MGAPKSLQMLTATMKLKDTCSLEEKHKLESRLLGEISIPSDMQMTSPLRQKVRGTRKPLDESERGE